MAGFWHQTKTMMTEEWVVPLGSVGDLAKAIQSARERYNKDNGLHETAKIPDAAIHFRTNDDCVILYYSYEAPECHC